MTASDLHKLLSEKISEGYGSIEFKGVCHDCGKPVSVNVGVEPGESEQWPMTISGGAIYGQAQGEGFDLKCDDCHAAEPILRNQSCEVYSRVVGYLRPVAQWNAGKKAEFAKRVNYSTSGLCGCR